VPADVAHRWKAAGVPGLRDTLVESYRRYNAVCNRHAFDDLTPFLCDAVRVNGVERTARQYIDDLFEVHHAFPDYRWEIQRTVFEEPWPAVHLRDAGTHLGPWHGREPSGRAVSTDEFAMYRFEDDRIAEVWVTADNARLVT
jgi:predicted ester cyclase